MSTQHTPGPWIGAGPSFGDPLPRYTTSIVTEWEDDAEGCIDICELPFRHHDDENEANARLIAAAPDLLESLKVARHMIVEDGTPIGWSVSRIDEVIAKAMGDEA
jgi:hypothetical protein